MKFKRLKKTVSFLMAFLILFANILMQQIFWPEENSKVHAAAPTISVTAATSSHVAYDVATYNDIKTNYANKFTTKATALEISTAGQLAAVAQVVNDGSATFEGKYIKLMNNINLGGSGGIYNVNNGTSPSDWSVSVTGTITNAWWPIGINSNYFKGTFDGNNKEIQNMIVINELNYAHELGLFGLLSNAKISNLNISNAKNLNKSTALSGILAGGGTGNITGCHVQGDLYSDENRFGFSSGGLIGGGADNSGSITDCYAEVNLYSYSKHVGGLVGCGNTTSITNCSATGDVRSFATNAIYIGGLVGSSSGIITNCSATGKAYCCGTITSVDGFIISGGLVGVQEGTSTIQNCFATGEVYTDAYGGGALAFAGGLVGSARIVKNCFASGNVVAYSGNRSSFAGGVVGRTYGDTDSFTHCYSTSTSVVAPGTPSASRYQYVGGVVGYTGSGVMRNCYYSTTKNTISGGAIGNYDNGNYGGGGSGNNVPPGNAADVKGLTDTQMQGSYSKSNFNNFVNQTYNDSTLGTVAVWMFPSESGFLAYPRLYSEAKDPNLTISRPSVTYGETGLTPSISRLGNGTIADVFYKIEGAADSTYTLTKPTTVGKYTVKLILNYSYTSAGLYRGATSTANFTIDKQELSMVAVPSFSAQKTYDGNTTVSQDPSVFQLTGLMTGDKNYVSLNRGTVSYSSKDVKGYMCSPLSFSGWSIGKGISDEDRSGNYYFTIPEYWGTINPKELTVANTGVKNKPFDNKTTASFSGTPSISGVLSADTSTVNLASGTPTFSNVGDVTKDTNVPYTFTTIFGIIGSSAGNYYLKQPNASNAIIQAGWESTLGTHYKLNGTYNIKNGKYYTSTGVAVYPETGYEIQASNYTGTWSTSSININTSGTKTFYLKRTSDGAISKMFSIDIVYDTTAPDGEVNFGTNIWKAFLNVITFGVFFKDTVSITIKGTDTNGVAKIEYLQNNDKEFDTENAAKLSNDSRWKDVTSSNSGNSTISYNYSITPSESEKIVVYLRLTDLAGNISVVNSNGAVVYKDSETQTQNFNFNLTSASDISATVNLKGNTIKKITYKNSSISETDINSSSYIVNNSIITFKASWLNTLAANPDYIFTVYYNPAGVVTASPEIKTTITAKINKAVQNSIVINGLNSNYIFGNSDFNISCEGGSGSGAVSYSSTNPSVASVNSSGKVSILNTGKFKIIVSKAEDANYSSASVESQEVTILPKQLNLIGLSVNTKEYDASTQATITGAASFNGKVAGSDNVFLKPVYTANFIDKNAGTNKEVVLANLELEGSDAQKYFINQTATLYGNINPRKLNISGISVKDREYNKTIHVGFNSFPSITNEMGKIGSDEVEILSITASFADGFIGDSKPVNVTEIRLKGIENQNYEVNLDFSEIKNLKGKIVPKSVDLNIIMDEKQYDGLTKASYSAEIVGACEGDYLEVKSKPEANFSDPFLGEGKEITFNGMFELDGNAPLNYIISGENPPTNIKGKIVNNYNAKENIDYSLSTPDGGNEWYKDNDFVISAKSGFAVSENNTDSSKWEATLSYSDETAISDKVFYVRNISSKAISNPISVSYKKDKEPPTGEISFKDNHFKEFLNTITFGLIFKETIDVSITATDTISGISNSENIYYYVTDAALTFDQAVNLSGEWKKGNSFSVQNTGKHIVYSKIIDNAGNATIINSEGLIIDLSEISINCTTNFNESEWTNDTNSRIDVNIVATEPVTGETNYPVVEEVTYKIGTNDAQSVEFSNKSNIKFSITSLPDGEYDVQIKAKSFSSFEYNKSIHVKKDTIKPIISNVYLDTSDWTNIGVTLNVIATDSLSGLIADAYSFDGGATWQESNQKNYEKNTTISVGTIKVKDSAGNEEVYSNIVKIENIDKHLPLFTSLDGASNIWTKEDVTLTVNAQDAQGDADYGQSQIDFFSYTFDAGKTWHDVKWQDSHEFVISEQGDYTNKIQIKVTDRAGNTFGPSVPYTVKIDKEAPNINSVSLNTAEPTNEDVTITVSSSDGFSGVFEYSFDGGINWHVGNTHICTENLTLSAGKIKVKDNAGNISTWNQDVVVSNIDKLAPSAPTVNVLGKTNSKNFPVSGEGEAGCTLKVQKGSDVIETLLVDQEGKWTCTLKNQPDGTNIYTFTLTDSAGNISLSTNAIVIVDTVAPLEPIVLNPLNNTFLNNRTPTLFGTGEESTKLYIKENSQIITTAIVNIYGNWSVVLPEQENGVHNYKLMLEDSFGNISAETSLTITIDSDFPTGSISIGDSFWGSVWETLTFGFFKNSTQQVNIVADGGVSGISEIRYYLPDEQKIQEFEKLTNSEIKSEIALLEDSMDEKQGWKKYENPFEVEKIENGRKYVIFSKITNMAGNISYLNTEGIVIYTDSAQATSLINHVKYSEDKTVQVNLNGNTIDKIKYSKTINNYETDPVLGADYVINGSEILLKEDFLNSLEADIKYEFKVFYNPLGERFIKGDMPETTTFDVQILKSQQTGFDFSNDFKLQNSEKFYQKEEIKITTQGGQSSSNNIKFLVLDQVPLISENYNEQVASVTQDKLQILQPGTFKLKAIKSGDNNYLENYSEMQVTVTKKDVIITGVKVENKVYDSTETATISNLGIIKDLEKGDDVEISVDEPKARFSDKHAGIDKKINLPTFLLTGKDVFKYNLKNQPAVVGNITQKEINVNLKIKNKNYDRTDTASYENPPALLGILDDDKVELIYKGSPRFSVIKIEKDIPVILPVFSISNNDYVIKQPVALASIGQPIDGIVTINNPDDTIFSKDPVISGTGVPEENMIIKNGDKTIGQTTVDKDGNWIIKIKDLPLGNHDLKVYRIYNESNVFFVGIKKAVSSFYTINDVRYSDLKNPIASGKGYSLDKIIIKDEDKVVAETVADKNGNWEVEIFNLPSGEYYLDVYVVNLDETLVKIGSIRVAIDFHYEDEKTKIIVDAKSFVLPKGSIIKIDELNKTTPERVTEFEKAYEAVDKKIKKHIERFKLFKIISFDSSGETTQPNGEITVSFPVPENFDNSLEDLDVYKVQFNLDDESLEESLVNINEKNYCQFKTDHLGTFAFIDKDLNEYFFVILLTIIVLVLLVLYMIYRVKRRT